MKGIAAPLLPALRTPAGQHTALVAVVGCSSLVVAAASSATEQWRPLAHVLALIVLTVVADLLPVETRTLRISSSLTVLVVIMALFGPAPAALAGALSMAVDAVVHRIQFARLMVNIATFSTLGLVGGLAFDAVDMPRDTIAFGAVVAGGYVVLTLLNFLLVATLGASRRSYTLGRAFAATYVPLTPWNLTSAVIAGGTVIAYEPTGLAVLAVLAGVMAITAPLLSAAVVAMRRADAMSELQAASDERAAEVARLASDRERLLREVLEVAEHERRRLADTLHDGPLQGLIALRQDLDEPSPELDLARLRLDAALSDTRAVMAAFHPEATTALGFEATVRAAAAPFLRGRVELEVDTVTGDERVNDPLVCSVARELVTNAVKHARPSRVRVGVQAGESGILLEVADDGRGIDSAATTRGTQAGHVGLAVARRRVEDAGGALEIRTVPTGGTQVLVSLPG